MPGPYRRRFLDSWRADDNVGFSATAMMRYRSRRDMLAMVMDPAFADGHIYKLAAIERTINYPTQMMMNDPWVLNIGCYCFYCSVHRLRKI